MIVAMDLLPNEQNFDLDKSRQNFIKNSSEITEIKPFSAFRHS